jgi:glycosyltransferase involved in cell wall biosynthesis
MKILYHHRIASKDGQYVHVEEIINSYRNLGHEVVIVAPDVAEESDFGSDGGWVDKLKGKLPKSLYETMEFGYSFMVLLKLILTILREKPDFIYERYNLFLPSGIWASKLTGIPLLLEVNAPLYEERKKHNGIALNWLAKWSQSYCWCNADMVLPVTDVLADYIRNKGVTEDRIDVIHNGINVDSFYADVGLPELPFEQKGKLVIGFVGFCREWHGLDRVLEVMVEQQNKDLIFLVVGDGPAIPQLHKKAKKLGLNEQFYVTGIINRKEMPKWLNVFEIALQPDVVPYASPLKMIEYLAKGKAIIAPNTSNIKELLDDGTTALLFDASIQDSFKEKLLYLCNNGERRKQLGLQAKKTIEDKMLTWDNNALRICNIAKRIKGNR